MIEQREPQPTPRELRPNPTAIDALRGRVSKPITTISHKPGFEGKIATVRIVEAGSGTFGLSDWRDNKEWAGLFNHVLLTTRYSLEFARKMAQADHDIDLQAVTDGMMVSHAGRRQWDEAFWYPEVVPDADAKREISNEALGVRLVEGKVSEGAYDLIAGIAYRFKDFDVDQAACDSWEYKISQYADHRITQKYEPLGPRLGEFLLGNFFPRDGTTSSLRKRVHFAMDQLIDQHKAHCLGKKSRAVSPDEADQVAEELGASPDSPRLTRRELMQLVLQDAETEAELIKVGVDPDLPVPMPKWEDKLRTSYIASAETEILAELQKLAKHPTRLDVNFPENTWWGRYVRSMYLSKNN